MKDWAAQQAADKAVRDQERSARDRADRATRAGTSTVTMSGFLNGTADQLAVSCGHNEYSGGLGVTVELVDPTYFGGPGALRGFNFEIPGGGRDGTYQLVDDGNFEALDYSIDIDGDQEGWCFHPTFGPGTIVVSDGMADVSLVFGASGSERIFMHGRIQLGAR